MSRSMRIGFWTVLGVVLAAAALVAAAAATAAGAVVEAGTYVAGIPVGGMDRAQVRATISGPLTARLAAPVRLLVDGEVIAIEPVPTGITLDRAATEAALLGSRPHSVLQSVLDRLRGEPSSARHDVVPVIAVNQQAATAALRPELSRFTRPAVEATMRLPSPIGRVLTEKGDAGFTARHAQREVTASQPGRTVDLTAAIAALRNAVARQRHEVRLRVVPVEPTVTAAEAGKVDQLIGTFTTDHPCCAPRVTNIHRIADLVDISHYPPGREATLDYDTIDQTIRNDTDAPVVIRTATTGTSVTVALYGHTGQRRVESTTGARFPRAGGGFSITVRRTVIDAGTVTSRDTLNWSYTGFD